MRGVDDSAVEAVAKAICSANLGDDADWGIFLADAHAAIAAMPAASEGEPVAWRCFHCGDTFTDEAGARLHFGRDERSEAACVIKAGAEGSLLKALRDAEYQADDAVQRVHDESTDAARAYHQQRCRHTQALTAAEELGYERGLADGRATPSDQEKLANTSVKTGSCTLEPISGAISDEAIRCLQIRSPLNQAIYQAIRDYRMGNMCDDEGFSYPLIDLMSNPAPSDISTGEYEMIALADEVCEAVEQCLTRARQAAETVEGGARD